MCPRGRTRMRSARSRARPPVRRGSGRCFFCALQFSLAMSSTEKNTPRHTVGTDQAITLSTQYSEVLEILRHAAALVHVGTFEEYDGPDTLVFCTIEGFQTEEGPGPSTCLYWAEKTVAEEDGAASLAAHFSYGARRQRGAGDRSISRAARRGGLAALAGGAGEPAVQDSLLLCVEDAGAGADAGAGPHRGVGAGGLLHQRPRRPLGRGDEPALGARRLWVPKNAATGGGDVYGEGVLLSCVGVGGPQRRERRRAARGPEAERGPRLRGRLWDPDGGCDGP